MSVRNDVPTGFFALQPGTRVKLQHCQGAYRLPDALQPGDEATVIYFDIGSYIVERNGGVFVISMLGVAENFDGVAGQWVHGDNPRKGQDSYLKLHRLAQSVKKLCGFMHGRDEETRPFIEGSYSEAQKVGFIGTPAAWKEAVRMA